MYDQAQNAKPAESRTLSARLESSAQRLHNQLDQLDDLLARIHGTPRTPAGAQVEKAINAIAPLATTVERLEGLIKRSGELITAIQVVA